MLQSNRFKIDKRKQILYNALLTQSCKLYHLVQKPSLAQREFMHVCRLTKTSTDQSSFS